MNQTWRLNWSASIGNVVEWRDSMRRMSSPKPAEHGHSEDVPAKKSFRRAEKQWKLPGCMCWRRKLSHVIVLCPCVHSLHLLLKPCHRETQQALIHLLTDAKMGAGQSKTDESTKHVFASDTPIQFSQEYEAVPFQALPSLEDWQLRCRLIDSLQASSEVRFSQKPSSSVTHTGVFSRIDKLYPREIPWTTHRPARC